ncbi:MAG: hypothetical protein JXQ29_06595 [Planctomycetes bacterium]|nr:hypothetical protein [Planctomycetota bacterium]
MNKALRSAHEVGAVIILLALFSVALSGCASFPAEKGTYQPGKILVLPPRDVVQNGVPHAKGVDSGKILQGCVSRALARSQFTVVETSNPSFHHTAIATKEEALQEAQRLNADYCLQLVLGEFLDAAPMTFRSDYVHLSDGVMYETSSGNAVWQLTKTLYLGKTNLGSFHPLLESLARKVAKSITSR